MLSLAVGMIDFGIMKGEIRYGYGTECQVEDKYCPKKSLYNQAERAPLPCFDFSIPDAPYSIW